MNSDLRYIALRCGVSQLEDFEIQRILDTPNHMMLFDGGNYDPITGNYCPLAIALDVPCGFKITGEEPSDRVVSNVIGIVGRRRNPKFIFNQLKGTPGEFYRENRAEDLRMICNEILSERNANDNGMEG